MARRSDAIHHGPSQRRGGNSLPIARGCVHARERMADLGNRHSLRILREAAPGLYLDGGRHGEILLPGRYIPRGAKAGGRLEVLVYRDSEDRLVATTEVPLATVGEFALLRVVGVHPKIGAFLDWGLAKDLLLPIAEQARPPRAGEWVLVRVLLDAKTDRILASTRLSHWLNLVPPTYAEGDAVRLIVESETPLGFNAIVNEAHTGLLYHSDLAGPLTTGQRLDGFVRRLRPDGKIDLALDRTGYRRIAPLTEQIVEALQAGGGWLPYHDQSSPEEIRAAFGVSKKAFKQAVGALYRERLIAVEKGGLRLLREA